MALKIIDTEKAPAHLEAILHHILADNPAAASRIIDVREFSANRPAVKFARRNCCLAVDDQFRVDDWREEAQRVKIRSEISPAPVTFKHTLSLAPFLSCGFRHFQHCR